MSKKTTYSPSRLNHYVKCPKMFSLSRQHKAKLGTSTMSAMRDGNLFEGYVFGFKDEQNEKELIGRKKPVTIDVIKGHAEQVKSIFKTGQPYFKISQEIEDYTIRGEADYIGSICPDAFADVFGVSLDFTECIVDLKYTGDIPRVWNEKESKEDYLQSVFYPYIWFRMTGEILPFIYIVVENNYQDAVKRAIIVKPTLDDFEWLQGFIDKVNSDFFMEAKPGYETCLGGRRGGRCWYLEHCEEGRKHAGGAKAISFSDLISKIDTL